MKTRRTLLGLGTAALLAAATMAVIMLGPGSTGPAPAGPQGGPPVLAEFGDFRCPHCATFAVHALPALEKEFISQGLLEYRYRHYPFLGQGSYRAAAASECARDQDMFRQYHDELYRQAHQGLREDHTSPENLLRTADELGLEGKKFRACMEDGSGMARADRDRAMGARMGVRGTPALFVDGEEVRWKDYRDLRAQIREKIRQSVLREQER